MSVALSCDSCGRLVADFVLPQRFVNGEGTTIAVSIEQGKKSLDLCRSCFAEMLAGFACAVAPCGVTYERKGQWCKVEEETE